jgi:tight adherence protein C
MSTDGSTLTMIAFVLVSSLILLGFLLLSGRGKSLEERLDQDAGGGRKHDDWSMSGAPPSSQAVAARVATQKEPKQQLRERLIQAGLYKQNSTFYFATVKLTLMFLPVLVGIAASYIGVVTFKQALMFGGLAGGFGTIIPSFWLDAQKSKRQTEIRRALPDALDVIVVCLEGGLSLPGAISRVSTELRTAHRTLAAEMTIVQREIQLGRSTGEALKRFADRFDVEELRSLSSVILQAEKFGASVVKALRVHAEGLRMKRRQHAEEMAQKASVKLVFPTVLFIFPALFVVLVGPAVFDIIKMFGHMAGNR